MDGSERHQVWLISSDMRLTSIPEPAQSTLKQLLQLHDGGYIGMHHVTRDVTVVSTGSFEDITEEDVRDICSFTGYQKMQAILNVLLCARARVCLMPVRVIKCMEMDIRRTLVRMEVDIVWHQAIVKQALVTALRTSGTLDDMCRVYRTKHITDQDVKEAHHMVKLRHNPQHHATQSRYTIRSVCCYGVPPPLPCNTSLPRSVTAAVSGVTMVASTNTNAATASSGNAALTTKRTVASDQNTLLKYGYAAAAPAVASIGLAASDGFSFTSSLPSVVGTNIGMWLYETLMCVNFFTYVSTVESFKIIGITRMDVEKYLTDHDLDFGKWLVLHNEIETNGKKRYQYATVGLSSLDAAYANSSKPCWHEVLFDDCAYTRIIVDFDRFVRTGYACDPEKIAISIWTAIFAVLNSNLNPKAKYAPPPRTAVFRRISARKLSLRIVYQLPLQFVIQGANSLKRVMEQVCKVLKHARNPHCCYRAHKNKRFWVCNVNTGYTGYWFDTVLQALTTVPVRQHESVLECAVDCAVYGHFKQIRLPLCYKPDGTWFKQVWSSDGAEWTVAQCMMAAPLTVAGTVLAQDAELSIPYVNQDNLLVDQPYGSTSTSYSIDPQRLQQYVDTLQRYYKCTAEVKYKPYGVAISSKEAKKVFCNVCDRTHKSAIKISWFLTDNSCTAMCFHTQDTTERTYVTVNHGSPSFERRALSGRGSGYK